MIRIVTMLRRASLASLALLVCSTVPLWAQEGAMPAAGLARQTLRPYWHVFIAYAIAILVVLAWVVSISRRLKDVEERLEE